MEYIKIEDNLINWFESRPPKIRRSGYKDETYRYYSKVTTSVVCYLEYCFLFRNSKKLEQWKKAIFILLHENFIDSKTGKPLEYKELKFQIYDSIVYDLIECIVAEEIRAICEYECEDVPEYDMENCINFCKSYSSWITNKLNKDFRVSYAEVNRAIDEMLNKWKIKG